VGMSHHELYYSGTLNLQKDSPACVRDWSWDILPVIARVRSTDCSVMTHLRRNLFDFLRDCSLGNPMTVG
jgi:hypothetical protein